MARKNLFKNSSLNFEEIDFPTAYYPSPQGDVKDTFIVPTHTVNTPNMLVFLDGTLMQRGREYDDISTTQIKFKFPIRINQEIFVILMVQKQTPPGGGGGNVTNNYNVKWQDDLKDVKFIKQPETNIPANPAYDGTIYVANDEANMYVGLPNNTKLKITDLMFVTSLPTTGLKGKLYLTPTELAFYSNGDWTKFTNSGASQPIGNIDKVVIQIPKGTFQVGDPVAYDNGYVKLQTKQQHFVGIVEEIDTTKALVVTYGQTSKVVGNEGDKVFCKNGLFDTTTAPDKTLVGYVVNGKLFVSAANGSTTINNVQNLAKWKEDDQTVVLTKNTLANKPNGAYDGSIFFSTDTAEQFISLTDGSMLKISDIMVVASLPLQGVENKLYITQNEMAVWTGGAWNKFAKGGGAIPQPETPNLVSFMLAGVQIDAGKLIGYDATTGTYRAAEATDEKLGVSIERKAVGTIVALFGQSELSTTQPNGTKIYWHPTNGLTTQSQNAFAVGYTVDNKLFIDLISARSTTTPPPQFVQKPAKLVEYYVPNFTAQVGKMVGINSSNQHLESPTLLEQIVGLATKQETGGTWIATYGHTEIQMVGNNGEKVYYENGDLTKSVPAEGLLVGYIEDNKVFVDFKLNFKTEYHPPEQNPADVFETANSVEIKLPEIMVDNAAQHKDFIMFNTDTNKYEKYDSSKNGDLIGYHSGSIDTKVIITVFGQVDQDVVGNEGSKVYYNNSYSTTQSKAEVGVIKGGKLFIQIPQKVIAPPPVAPPKQNKISIETNTSVPVGKAVYLDGATYKQITNRSQPIAGFVNSANEIVSFGQTEIPIGTGGEAVYYDANGLTLVPNSTYVGYSVGGKLFVNYKFENRPETTTIFFPGASGVLNKLVYIAPRGCVAWESGSGAPPFGIAVEENAHGALIVTHGYTDIPINTGVESDVVYYDSTAGFTTTPQLLSMAVGRRVLGRLFVDINIQSFRGEYIPPDTSYKYTDSNAIVAKIDRNTNVASDKLVGFDTQTNNYVQYTNSPHIKLVGVSRYKSDSYSEIVINGYTEIEANYPDGTVVYHDGTNYNITGAGVVVGKAYNKFLYVDLNARPETTLTQTTDKIIIELTHNFAKNKVVGWNLSTDQYNEWQPNTNSTALGLAIEQNKVQVYGLTDIDMAGQDERKPVYYDGTQFSTAPSSTAAKVGFVLAQKLFIDLDIPDTSGPLVSPKSHLLQVLASNVQTLELNDFVSLDESGQYVKYDGSRKPIGFLAEKKTTVGGVAIYGPTNIEVAEGADKDLVYIKPDGALTTTNAGYKVGYKNGTKLFLDLTPVPTQSAPTTPKDPVVKFFIPNVENIEVGHAVGYRHDGQYETATYDTYCVGVCVAKRDGGIDVVMHGPTDVEINTGKENDFCFVFRGDITTQAGDIGNAIGFKKSGKLYVDLNAKALYFAQKALNTRELYFQTDTIAYNSLANGTLVEFDYNLGYKAYSDATRPPVGIVWNEDSKVYIYTFGRTPIDASYNNKAFYWNPTDGVGQRDKKPEDMFVGTMLHGKLFFNPQQKITVPQVENKDTSIVEFTKPTEAYTNQTVFKLDGSSIKPLETITDVPFGVVIGETDTKVKVLTYGLTDVGAIGTNGTKIYYSVETKTITQSPMNKTIEIGYIIGNKLFFDTTHCICSKKVDGLTSLRKFVEGETQLTVGTPIVIEWDGKLIAAQDYHIPLGIIDEIVPGKGAYIVTYGETKVDADPSRPNGGLMFYNLETKQVQTTPPAKGFNLGYSRLGKLFYSPEYIEKIPYTFTGRPPYKAKGTAMIQAVVNNKVECNIGALVAYDPDTQTYVKWDKSNSKQSIIGVALQGDETSRLVCTFGDTGIELQGQPNQAKVYHNGDYFTTDSSNAVEVGKLIGGRVFFDIPKKPVSKPQLVQNTITKTDLRVSDANTFTDVPLAVVLPPKATIKSIAVAFTGATNNIVDFSFTVKTKKIGGNGWTAPGQITWGGKALGLGGGMTKKEDFSNIERTGLPADIESARMVGLIFTEIKNQPRLSSVILMVEYEV